MTVGPGHDRRTTAMVGCGTLAGPLFIVTFLLEGATRAGYDPVRHPVSSLALGSGGWVQVANFTAAGAVYLAFAVGLSRARRQRPVGPRSAAVLVGAVAVGLLGAGAFVTDPVSGYPPGTSGHLAAYSTSGALHDAFSALTFLGLPAVMVTYAWWSVRRGNHGWAGYSLGSALAFVIAFGFASAAFDQASGLVAHGGLFQRAAVTVGFTWLTVLAVRVRRAVTSTAPVEAATPA
jgi:hypothetical protein